MSVLELSKYKLIKAVQTRFVMQIPRDAKDNVAEIYQLSIKFNV